MMRIPSYRKYGNRRVLVNGVWCGSKKEGARYAELLLLERSGKIRNLVCQPQFILQPSFVDNTGKHERMIAYRADFSYVDVERGNVTVVEDAKGYRTAEYRIKSKLFRCKYPEYIFLET